MNPTSIPRVNVGGTANVQKKKKKTSTLRTIFEFVAFIAWLGLTGYGGYYMGYDTTAVQCPPSNSNLQGSNQVPVVNQQIEIVEEVIEEDEPCPAVESTSSKTTKKTSTNSKLPMGTDVPLSKEDGFTLDELKASWECSYGLGNDENKVHEMIFSDKDLNQQKTKWKSVISVEPKAFFDRFLSQYPGDIRATQPVVIFSHKPLKDFNELTDVCKVLDIAIVPDKPGTCVAVTETYHDVASYHMLHADRLKNGEFGLTSNFVDGRTLPSEDHYEIARKLYLEYFRYNDDVQSIIRGQVPKYTKGKVTIGVLMEDTQDIDLFLNSFKSAETPGINKGKFAIFTTSPIVKDHEGIVKTGIKVVYFPFLTNLGKELLSDEMRHAFLMSWFTFSCANQLVKMMWQAPSTIWYERPDNIISSIPAVETQWIFTGREDRRAAPYFISMDFFVMTPNERPVHLLHEMILHFDLILAWKSLDAVTSYRLIENNSR